MNSDPRTRINVARSSLLIKQPFWGSLALYFKIEEDPNIETMQTDGESLVYNPKFLDELSELELEGVLAHETSHCAYLHHTRRGDRDPRMWNESCDYAINRDLERAGFRLPKDALRDSRFDNMTAEQIYMVVQREEDKQQKQSQGSPQQGQGQPQAGQGQGQGSSQGQGKPSRDPGRCGEVVDAAKGQAGQSVANSRAESEWRVRVMQAMAAEGGKYAGNLPAEIKRMFESIRKPPQDWRALLRRFVDEKNRTDYAWTKPNKRYLGSGFILPGLIPDGVNQIGIVIDTSGSIDKRALGFFVNEMQAILDDGLTKKVTVISCDTIVQERYDFQEGDQIKFQGGAPKGGGGTKFSPAIKWFAQNEPDVVALIYFTDLDCSDYGDEPWVPMMWLAYGSVNDIRDRAKRVPFGEIVPLVE